MKLLAFVLICSMLLFSQVMPPVNSPMSMCPAASASQTGCLASTDWSTFNGKQAALGFTAGNVANPLSQFAATTSAQLRGIISDETGTGFAVFSTSPAFTGTPTVPTQSPGDNSTKIASTAYIAAAITAISSAQVISSLGFTPGNIANPLSQFASTTSAQLQGIISDETGTGFAVFSGSPALTGTPTAPTPSQADGSTKLATTAYVDTGLATKQASLGFTPFQVPYATAIQLTGQTSAITTTTIATPAAGIYNVCGYLVTTTTGSAGTAGVTFGWNDGTQAETDTPTKLTAVTLTALGEGQGCTYLKSNGSAITYAVALTSVIGSPQYSFYSTIQRMN
jgi:hypothetical protein